MKTFNFILFLVLSIICFTLDNSVEGLAVLKCQSLNPTALLSPQTWLLGSVVSAGVGALGSVFSSIFGSSSSKKSAELAYRSQQETNATNLEIARQTNETNTNNIRETNQANLDLAKQQNQWNIEQWNRENEYNSPANQVELYKAAGLNPALVGGQFTPAQPLQSVDLANQQAPQVFAPQIQDPAKAALPYKQQALEYLQKIGTSIGEFANGIGDAAIKQSQIKRNEFLNNVSKYDIKIAQQQEKLMVENIRKIKQENDFLSKSFEQQLIMNEQNISLNDQMFTFMNEKIATEHGMSRLVSNQADHEELKKAISYINLIYLGAEKESDLAKTSAEIYEINQRGMNTQLENDFMRNNGGFRSSDVTAQFVSNNALEGTKYSADMHYKGLREEGRANRWTQIQMQNQRLSFEDKWKHHSELREWSKIVLNSLAVGVGSYFGVSGGGKFAGGVLRTVRAFKAGKLPIPEPKIFNHSLKPREFHP